ncbi:MAG TPA: hypothetical protein DIT13_10195 [Verrucomicrobiales bacterium]|nr:hypothetical protein [Verrucomicrobiales bacterium]
MACVRATALQGFGQFLGSGDVERKTLLTRQTAFEPLPASVLFGLVFTVRLSMWESELQWLRQAAIQ